VQKWEKIKFLSEQTYLCAALRAPQDKLFLLIKAKSFDYDIYGF
jgi:hypothetical protein